VNLRYRRDISLWMQHLLRILITALSQDLIHNNQDTLNNSQDMLLNSPDMLLHNLDMLLHNLDMLNNLDILSLFLQCSRPV